jgi:hypothetical protein
MSPERLSTSDIAAAGERPRPAPARVERGPQDREHAHPGPHDHDELPAQLFQAEDATKYRQHWSRVQTSFVDEPRRAVEEADRLVAAVMKRLAEVFSDERRHLEAQWEKSDQVSTEDLRQAMRRYRSFFERLLAV